MFYQHFEATLVDLPSVPEASRQQALAQLQPTRALFGPLQPGEEAAAAEGQAAGVAAEQAAQE